MKTGLALGLASALQLLTNFALQIVVLPFLGVGPETDAYVAAQTVPLLVFSVVSASLQSVWQSRLAILSTDADGWRSAQGIALGQMLLLLGGLVGILLVTTGIWVRVLFPGMGEAQIALTEKMTHLMLIGSVFNGMAAISITAQRARDRFLMAEIVPLVGSILMIGVVAATVKRFGVEGVAWVSLMRSFAVCIVMNLVAGRPFPSVTDAWRNADTLKKMGTLLAGSSLYKTGPVIDRYWSSQVPAGGVTIFNLVQAGMGALSTIIDRSTTVSATPRLARLANAGDLVGMRKIYRRCIWQAGIVVACIFVLLIAVKPVWAILIWSVLKIQEPFANQLWQLCLLMLGYLLVAGCGNIVVTAFYALGDVHTPVMMSTVVFIGGAILKSYAFVLWGLQGLAVGTSIYYLFNLVAMCVLLERRINARLP